MVFPDTSFLCALYRRQDNSDKALAFRAAMTEPLPVSRLLLWEFRQSARFQAFRYHNDPRSGYALEEAEKMMSDLQDDEMSGMVIIVECDLVAILAEGERLSKTHTAGNGHRGLDILHVATALQLGATEFLSFDANQRKLAKASGLRLPV